VHGLLVGVQRFGIASQSMQRGALAQISAWSGRIKLDDLFVNGQRLVVALETPQGAGFAQMRRCLLRVVRDGRFRGCQRLLVALEGKSAVAMPSWTCAMPGSS
jgi:hypothetical protein